MYIEIVYTTAGPSFAVLRFTGGAGSGASPAGLELSGWPAAFCSTLSLVDAAEGIVTATGTFCVDI